MVKLSYIVQIGIISVFYFGAAKLGSEIIGHPGALWPSAGIALAIIMIMGYRFWPCIAIGAFLVTFLQNTSVTIAFTTMLAGTSEALIGSYLLHRTGFRKSLDEVKDVIKLVVLGCLASATVGATIAAAGFWYEYSTWASTVSFWWNWLMGDALGILVYSPILLTISTQKRPYMKNTQIVEALVLIVALVFVSFITLGQSAGMVQSPYLMFPLLIWAALRFGQIGATAVIMLVSSIAIWYTTQGQGHFVKERVGESLYFVQIFIVIISLTILVLASVISERKKTNADLLISEERFRILFEQATDAILIISNEGKIISVNNRACIMLNYQKEELCSLNVADLMDPGLIAEIPEIMVKLGSEEPLVFQTHSRRKDGSLVDVDLSLKLIHLKDQDVIQVFARDITERKKIDQLRYEKEVLVEASKAKSEFLASMSHELRTPLNSIIGFSEIMKQKMAGELSAKQEHFIDNINTSGMFLLSLIDDILDLSKVEAGKIELVYEKMYVPLAITESLTLIKEKAMKHNVKLKTEFDLAVDYISADKQRFKQIIFNLLSNAVKFSKKDGGTITIITKKENDLVKISVSDTGIGIKKENIKKLFQKFEQLDPETSKIYGGTGLGLAITKKLVELHGGKIWAESTFGEGSMFTFILPIEKIEKQEIISVDKKDEF